MAIEQKIGAGRKPQNFDTHDGQYVKEGNSAAYSSQADPAKTLSERVKRVTRRAKKSSHRDIPSGMTKEQFIAEELDIAESKAKEYVDAIYSYTLGTYSNIRKYQQGGESSARIRKAERAIEEYIAKAPKWNGGETFRGVGLSDEELSAYSIGSVHDMLGTSSWSSDAITAQDFADWEGDNKEKGKTNAVIFHSPTQSQGTSIRHLSRYNSADVNDESEVLVSKRSKYKVVRQSKDNDGRIHIFLEEE